jgi:branched-chain amino acid transport system ATP-binding protein
MQQRIVIAMALGVDPALLILDELSIGLAPLIVEELYGRVAQVAEEGVAILVVEQFASIALGVASRAAVMMHGRVVHEGTPDEVESTLSQTYLGSGA